MNLSTALLNLMLLINVSVCYASPRARKKPDSPIAIISEQTIIEKAKKSGYEVTFIDGSTCNDSLNPNRTLIFCHHKGKCSDFFLKQNQTHYIREAKCECPPPYSGKECRENDSFIEADISVILIIVVLSLTVLGAVLIAVVMFNRGKHANKESSDQEQQAQKKPILRPQLSVDTAVMINSRKVKKQASNPLRVVMCDQESTEEDSNGTSTSLVLL